MSLELVKGCKGRLDVNMMMTSPDIVACIAKCELEPGLDRNLG